MTSRRRRVGLLVASVAAAVALVLGWTLGSAGHHRAEPLGGNGVPIALPGFGPFRQGPPGSKPGYDPTLGACTGHRAFEALQYGVGPICVPWDSIPAIDGPHFVDATDARFLSPKEPVVTLDMGGVHRAYPVQILLYDELVNDVVGGRPVLISFCPLCNSAVGYSRVVRGMTLTFGVTGQLNYGNLVMFDRQTFSELRQLTGIAVSGELKGTHLKLIPLNMVGFGGWRAEHPDGLVLRRPTGTGFHYGLDPYHSYVSNPQRQSIVVQGQRHGPTSSADVASDRGVDPTRIGGLPSPPAAGNRDRRDRQDRRQADRGVLPVGRSPARTGRSPRLVPSRVVGDGVVLEHRLTAAAVRRRAPRLHRAHDRVAVRPVRPGHERSAIRTTSPSGPAGHRLLVRVVLLLPGHQGGRWALTMLCFGGPEPWPPRARRSTQAQLRRRRRSRT